MTSWRNVGAGRAAVLLAGLAMMAAPVGAQVTNTVVPAPLTEPTTAATPVPIPPAPVIVLPPVARTRAPLPRPSVTPTPEATPTPAPEPSPQPTAEAPAQVEPAPVVTASPSPAPTTVALPSPARAETSGSWWPYVGAGVLVLLALGWALSRRRSSVGGDALEPADEAAAEAFEAPIVEPLPATLTPPTAPRARLTLGFRPIRAGLNLLSATSENEIVLTNSGDAPAHDIRVLAQLVSAHGDQDAELAALHAVPIARPTVPAFTLQPGEQRVLTAVAALPRDAIRAMTAAGRPMFVPLVAVNATYATAGAARQLAQAFAVGVERVDSAKLAPFWLDVPPRTYDQVAARPHAAPLER